MICASEQAVVIDKEIKEEFEKLMKESNCYFLSEEEKAKAIKQYVYRRKGCALNANIVGKKSI